MQRLLHQSRKAKPVPQASGQRLDHLLAQGFPETQIREFQSTHFRRGNPGLYTGEVPVLLSQGKVNLKQAPAAWTERAIRECDGALAFLAEGTELLTASGPIEDARFARASESWRRGFSGASIP